MNKILSVSLLLLMSIQSSNAIVGATKAVYDRFIICEKYLFEAGSTTCPSTYTALNASAEIMHIFLDQKLPKVSGSKGQSYGLRPSTHDEVNSGLMEQLKLSMLYAAGIWKLFEKCNSLDIYENKYKIKALFSRAKRKSLRYKNTMLGNQLQFVLKIADLSEKMADKLVTVGETFNDKNWEGFEVMMAKSKLFNMELLEKDYFANLKEIYSAFKDDEDQLAEIDSGQDKLTNLIKEYNALLGDAPSSADMYTFDPIKYLYTEGFTTDSPQIAKDVRDALNEYRKQNTARKKTKLAVYLYDKPDCIRCNEPKRDQKALHDSIAGLVGAKDLISNVVFISDSDKAISKNKLKQLEKLFSKNTTSLTIWCKTKGPFPLCYLNLKHAPNLKDIWIKTHYKHHKNGKFFIPKSVQSLDMEITGLNSKNYEDAILFTKVLFECSQLHSNFSLYLNLTDFADSFTKKLRLRKVKGVKKTLEKNGFKAKLTHKEKPLYVSFEITQKQF